MSEFNAIDAARAAEALSSIMSSGTNPSSADFGAAGLLGVSAYAQRKEQERRSQEMQAELDARQRMKQMELASNALNISEGRSQDWAKLLLELMQKRWALGQGREQKREELSSQERQRQILAEAMAKKQEMAGRQGLMRILQQAVVRPQKVDTNSMDYMQRVNQIRKENKAMSPAEAKDRAYQEIDKKLNPVRYNNGPANLIQQMGVPVESGAANFGPRSDAGGGDDYSALQELLAMYG